MDGELSFQLATAKDAGFLLDMLVEAVNWPPDRHLSRATVAADPALARYIEGWPRPGDLGLIAHADGDPIGAAWMRMFPADDPGYGYVADDVPELSIAVMERWRGCGVGRALLQEIAHRARSASRAPSDQSQCRAGQSRSSPLRQGGLPSRRAGPRRGHSAHRAPAKRVTQSPRIRRRSTQHSTSSRASSNVQDTRLHLPEPFDRTRTISSSVSTSHTLPFSFGILTRSGAGCGVNVSGRATTTSSPQSTMTSGNGASTRAQASPTSRSTHQLSASTSVSTPLP